MPTLRRGRLRAKPRDSPGESDTSKLSEYPDLATLRGDLAGEGEARTDAVMAVMSVDLRPEEVLSDEPPVEKLVDEEIIPEDEGPDERPTGHEHREQIISLLEEIAANTGGTQ